MKRAIGLGIVLASLGCVEATRPIAVVVEADDAPEATFAGDELDDALVADADDANWRVSPAVTLETGANRVALMASLHEIGEAPRVRVRGIDGDVTGPWQEASWTFDESGYLAGAGALGDLFVDVQIAVAAVDVERLDTLTFSPAWVDESGIVADEAAAESQGLRAELAFVGVQPRSAWGARGHHCSSTDGDFYRAALHHTAARSTANPELALRQAQAYHMDGRGYCDIAYHFGVAQDGRVFELRPMPFRGGHTLNNNSGNVGIVFLGCFDPACGNDQPTEALLNAGAGMVAMMNILEGVAVNSDRVRGHRDHSGAQTACPGAHLHPRLEEIRQRARNILDDLNNGPPPPPAQPPPPGCGVVSPGDVLGRGASKTSCDGRFTLAHQGDGNVVLYQGGTALWATGTHGRATTALIMQHDGNFVLYNDGNALWASGTHGHPGAWAAVQGDGNLVVYSGTSPLWATHTCCR